MTGGETYVAVPLLAVASAFDVCRRRIPNSLTVALAAAGTANAFWARGASGGLSAVVAAAVVLLALIPLWRCRALGGGDLKLGVAAATWVGLSGLVPFAVATALGGGVLAVACWLSSANAVRREIVANLKLATQRAMPAVTIGREGGRVSVPYGVAIAVATIWMVSRG